MTEGMRPAPPLDGKGLQATAPFSVQGSPSHLEVALPWGRVRSPGSEVWGHRNQEVGSSEPDVRAPLPGTLSFISAPRKSTLIWGTRVRVWGARDQGMGVRGARPGVRDLSSHSAGSAH